VTVAEGVVELERRLSAPPIEVFAYWTDPARYVRWMGREAELDARPGGVYRVVIGDGIVALGEFVEVDAPHRVVFTFGWVGDEAVPPGSTRVEIDLSPLEGGTLLRLRHTTLPPDAAPMHRQGWELYTSRLEVVVAGGTPPPEPPHMT
jgi:uncharacterized protein YndB with AHSA1/START domain